MSKGKDQKNLPSQKPTDNKPLESSGVSDSRYIKIDDKFYSLKEAAEFRGTDEAGIIQHAIDCRTFIYLSIPDGRETRVTKKDLITFLAKPKISIKFSELRETFADYLSALEEQSNDDYRDGIKSSEKPFDTELKSIRAQYFKRASDCDYQVSTNNFKIYKHDLDLTNKSSEYSSLIDHAIGLKEISEELKKPIESILGYVSHGAIPLYYIVTHGYYKSLTMVDLDKFLEDIDIKIPMPIRDVEQLIRAKFVSRYAVNPSHSTKRFITMSRLRIFKEDLPALEKRLKVENNKENKKVKVKKKAKDDYNDVKLKMYVDWKGNYSNSIFEVSLIPTKDC